MSLALGKIILEIIRPCNYLDPLTCLFHYLIGSCRLCRHNFENNRCVWEFENIPGIIGNFLRIMRCFVV